MRGSALGLLVVGGVMLGIGCGGDEPSSSAAGRDDAGVSETGGSNGPGGDPDGGGTGDGGGPDPNFGKPGYGGGDIAQLRARIT